METDLVSDDYQFFIGMAADLVNIVFESRQFHVETPDTVRLYDDRMKVSCGNFVGRRLNLGYDKAGLISSAWIG